MAHNGKLENYLKGLRDGMGIGIAYTPFGITIGLISKNFGMKLFTAIVMSFGLYAGSAQTAFLKMVYELKSTPVEIIVSIFVINLRYTLLNIIMFRQISNKTTLFEKILMGIGLTDEAVAYLTIRKATNVWYVIGVNTMPYVLFGVGTIAGSLFGNLIPEFHVIRYIFKSSCKFINKQFQICRSSYYCDRIKATFYVYPCFKGYKQRVDFNNNYDYSKFAVCIETLQGRK